MENKKIAILAEGEKKKAAWLEKNGFDADGYTYILIGLDTYAIKEELKEKGYKYNSFLRWHSASPVGYEKNVYKMHWTEGFEASAWGDMYPIEGIQAKVDNLINKARPKSPSEWVGEIGKRLRDIPVTLLSMHGFEGRFGYSNVLKFVDEDQNIYTWFTSAEIGIEVGESCFLSGSVKDHSEYKEEKTTILTRCRLT